MKKHPTEELAREEAADETNVMLANLADMYKKEYNTVEEAQKDYPAYHFFYDYLVSAEMGKSEYFQVKRQMDSNLRDLVTGPSESFTSLAINNYRARWMYSARFNKWGNELDKKKKGIPGTLYTQSGAGVKKNEGWKEEGKKLYHDIRTAVARRRELDWWKNNYMEAWRAQRKPGSSKVDSNQEQNDSQAKITLDDEKDLMLLLHKDNIRSYKDELQSYPREEYGQPIDEEPSDVAGVDGISVEINKTDLVNTAAV